MIRKVRFVNCLLLLLMFTIVSIGCETKEEAILKNNEILNTVNGKIKYADGTEPDIVNLDRDYYFMFYGADWCPFCKEIRDDILNFYNEYKKLNDNFEFIFVGCKKDTSNDDLVKYLENEGFPFCYIEYEYRDECGFFEFPAFSECEYFYIPGFILLDKTGNVLSNSNGALESDYVATRPFVYYIDNLSSK